MLQAEASRSRYLRLAVTLAVVCGLVALAPASAGTQRYGGTLVVGVWAGEANSLDPTVGNSQSRVPIDTMCLKLYEYADNHGRLELDPVLAAAPPALSADKLRYTIRLKRGLLFNDGTPFNAQAVIATYQRYVSYPGSLWAGDFAGVDSVTASGPYAVVYHLTQRDSTFSGNMYVLSPTALSKEGANFAANPICVSPFMFDHRVIGDNVTLVKSPYYYKRSAVYLDKIVFKTIPDPAAAVAALEAGDVQLTMVDPTLLPTVQQDSSLRVLSAPQFQWFGIVINIGNRNGVGNLPYTNVGTPLAQSPTLRQAFEEAIDRTTLNKVVFDGLYRPSCTLIPAADTLWYEQTKVRCTPYDPVGARKLVARSGFPTPITVHLLIGNNSEQLRLAQFVQAEEAAVGFNVVIDAVDQPTLRPRAGSGQFDTALIGSATDPEPNTLITRGLDTVSTVNYGGYSNPRLDYVLKNGLLASSLKARAVNYRVAQQIVHDDRPIIVLYARSGIYAFNASLLTGVQLNAVGGPSLVNAQYR
jgi:peptide/nickel transport system substrate-binding protein